MKQIRWMRGLLMALLALALIGLTLCAALIGFVYYKETHLPEQRESDVIIVLGAQVKPDGTPCSSSQSRITSPSARGSLAPCAPQTMMICRFSR